MILRILMLTVLGMLAAASAMAQGKPRPHAQSAATPLDKGPFTPEANAAYQGGGVILQGAPGAPAPTPEATPPGQTPRNSVPLR